MNINIEDCVKRESKRAEEEEKWMEQVSDWKLWKMTTTKNSAEPELAGLNLLQREPRKKNNNHP